MTILGVVHKQNNMRGFLSLFIIILFSLNLKVIAQRPADMPGYTPLVPRLMSEHHKENSNNLTIDKLSNADFNRKTPLESINIYTTYEFDMDIAKDNKSLTNPPEKLMIFDIVYSYRYLIPNHSNQNINELLPTINLGSDLKLYSLKANYLYGDKGKMKSKKISKNQISTDTTSNQFTIRLDESIIPNNTILELTIEFSSQTFNTIKPTFNNKGNFERQLIFSLPGIFEYDLHQKNTTLELVSEDAYIFKFLNIHRNTNDWNRIVEVFKNEYQSYSWKVTSNSQIDLTFELQGLRVPINIDIGVPRTLLYR